MFKIIPIALACGPRVSDKYLLYCCLNHTNILARGLVPTLMREVYYSNTMWENHEKHDGPCATYTKSCKKTEWENELFATQPKSKYDMFRGDMLDQKEVSRYIIGPKRDPLHNLWSGRCDFFGIYCSL